MLKSLFHYRIHDLEFFVNLKHTVLAICPHADDAAAFFGGTLAKFSNEGWNVVLVRVTDDCKDSVGSNLADTIHTNTEQLHAAAEFLGVDEIVGLDYETDALADVSKVDLRERIVYLFRKYRPYTVISFDPFGMYEGNMDHIVVAQAVEEAYWVSCFDLHYPEHFDEEGVTPFSVCERWYYGRNLPGANHAEDVTDYMKANLNALCAHDMMMRNLVSQLRLQAQTWGKTIPILEDVQNGDLRPLLHQFLYGRAQAVAVQAGLPEGHLAESFRVTRFGDFEALFQSEGIPIKGAIPAPKRNLFGEDE
jgi:LmbE family N-acetylglucosaminyl deacetylase